MRQPALVVGRLHRHLGLISWACTMIHWFRSHCMCLVQGSLQVGEVLYGVISRLGNRRVVHVGTIWGGRMCQGTLPPCVTDMIYLVTTHIWDFTLHS